jgi:class 3 adenylate cyclase
MNDASDLRSFLIADVRGYTRFTNERGDEAASQLAGRFAGLTRAAVAEYGGTLLELRGDEALCVFSSARQAIRAAVELQRRFRERTDGQPAFPLDRSTAKHYRKSAAVTEYKEFPDRSHYTIGQPGWEEVADYALEWAATNARISSPA